MAREAWADVGGITGNLAIALVMNGELDKARRRRLESAEAEKKAGSAAINVIGTELEALPIDILQGRAAQALPEVETRLAQVEISWRQHRAGQSVPEAPNPELLARALISALDIARHAYFDQQDGEPALRCINATLEVKRVLERPAEDIAATRINRATVLTSLGRHAEAKVDLEYCLQVFQTDPASRATVFSSFADLFSQQGDVGQAITQERRALALREALPDPRDRAISHPNLANYLERSGMPSALAESARHRLAALVYLLVSGLGQDLQTTLHNYVVRYHHAQAAGTELRVPRVAELLADPAFRPLDDWLRQRQTDVGQVQADVDRLLDQARQLALEQK